MRGRVKADPGSRNLRSGMQTQYLPTEPGGVLQVLPVVRSEEEKRNFLLPLTAVKGKKNEVCRRLSSI